MSAPRNFITGFNHNVQHKGQVFHVQTEDSGVDLGHIITHLFLGGNIVASKKTSYREMLGAPNIKDLVRALMEEQHKEMLRNLVSGVYDEPLPQAPKAPRRQEAARPPPPPATWPWSGTDRPHTPPPFPAPKLSQEPRSWPAESSKPLPPPLPREKRQEAPTESEKAPTLFSEDLVSDRSLDEVILRYLSGGRDPD